MKAQPESNERSRYGQRRKRTYFSNRQLNRLEEVFQENKFPGIEIRERLTDELAIREDRIQVWFQNRRARWRRHEIKNKPATSSDVEPVPTLPSLIYPYGVPQFTYPTDDALSACMFQPAIHSETAPSPTPSTCQESTYGLTYSKDEYAAAFGLLSVFGRQD